MTRLARALACALVLGGCSPQTDIVAKRALVLDAAPEAALPDPDTGVPDAAPDAPPDAEVVVDASDTGMPPMLGDCSARTCDALDSRADFCAPARPASVVIGDTCDPTTGEQQFGFAICSCTDLVTNSTLEVDSLGGTAPAASASIAVNDMLQLGTDTSIDGSVYVTGQYVAAATPRVTGLLEEDAERKCVCDDPRKLFNAEPLIEARELDNDNASLSLATDVLDGFAPGRTLALDCGRYYLDRVVGTGPLLIEARGRVALFIGGDISVNGPLTLTLQNGASAEIYVLGNVTVTGRLELSTGNDGNRVLLVVHGGGTIDLADATIDGSIYAPTAELVTKGPFEANGSLFVQRANFGSDARVHFPPRPVARAVCSN